MSDAEYQAALAGFLVKKAVTRCPTACVAPVRISVSEKDRTALRSYTAIREAARLERLRTFQSRLSAD